MARPQFRQWVATIIGDGHSGSGEKFAVETQGRAVEAADVLLLRDVDRIRNPRIRWRDKGMPGMRSERRVDLIQDRMRNPIPTRARNGAGGMGRATVFIGVYRRGRRVWRRDPTEALMLKAMPGVFAAGEMLDWEAPTGGYLLTACLATGRWALSQDGSTLSQARR